MTYATHLLSHSRKLHNAPGILWNEFSILVHWFSKDSCPSIGQRDDLLKTHRHDYLSGKKDGNLSIGVIPNMINRSYSCRYENLDTFTVSLSGGLKGNFYKASVRMSIPVASSVFSSPWHTQEEVFQQIQALLPPNEMGLRHLIMQIINQRARVF